MNESDVTKNPPTTIREIGIHLAYQSTTLKEIQETLKVLPNGFATKEELLKVEKRVNVLEKKQTLKNTLLWVGLVASAIINIVMVYETFGSK
jgi:hypothetical protein